MGAFRTSLILALSIALPLAGCLTNDDDGTQPTSPTDDDIPAFTKEQAAVVFDNAASSLTSDEGPDRVAMKFRADALNSSTEGDFAEMSALFDREKGLVLISMKGEFAEQSGESNPFAQPGEAFVLGQVWKTTLFGSTTSMLAMYNESAEPPTNMTDVSGPSTPDGGSGEGFDQDEFLKFLGNPDADAIKSVEPIVHDRKPAMKVTFGAVEEGVTVNGEAVIVVGPPARLAYVAGTIKDPNAENDYERDATFRVDLTYDAAATHELESTAERLEVLAFAGNNAGSFSPFGGGEPSDTFTIQPSHSGVDIGLAEVEARIVEQSGFGGDTDAPPALTLALEAGTAENENVKATFTDADGNGKVSAGDFVKIEPKNPDTAYTVTLYDEKTGVTLMPGFGFLAALAALGALAIALRRR